MEGTFLTFRRNRATSSGADTRDVAEGCSSWLLHPSFPSFLAQSRLSSPQDGPSAGVAMAVALASLVTGRKVKPTIAMTGKDKGKEERGEGARETK